MTQAVMPILTHANQAQLAAAVEDNLYAMFQAMQSLPNAEMVEGERLSYHDTFPSGPMFKSVWRVRLAPDEVDPAVDEAIDWFKQRHAPMAAWWLSSASTPPNLADRLKARGFTTDYAGDPGMAADLHALNERPIPEGLVIVQAQNEATLADWRSVLCAAFNLPDFIMQSWVDATLALGIARAPWTHYVGYYRGEPIATNFLFNGGGVAGLYCIATAPKAQHRGFGTAITLQPLIDARASGYNYAVLFASPSGAPMYERIGFRDTGNHISRFVWHNDS